VLQHGSVLLQSSPHAPQLPGIAELTSRAIPLSELATIFAERVGEVLAISWETGDWTDQEIRRTTAVVHDKFDSDRWLRRR
jgi:lipoate-protein ligase A